jgi:hypothetical protein
MITSDSGIPTPGLPGFRTHTLTAVSDDPITAIDFVGDGRNDPSTGKGFFGPMNQISLPASLTTIFSDNNALIPLLSPGHTAQEDSHFLVLSTNVVVPPGLAEEGPKVLQAAWAWSSSPGHVVPFAQIVVPESTIIGFRGTITALVDGVQTDFPVSRSWPFVSTPPIVVDVSPNTRLAGSVVSHAFTTSQGSEPIIWGSLIVTGPAESTPANAPTLNSIGQFHWQSAPNDRLGTYVFEVTAANFGGSDVGRLTVILVPEPATWVLLAPVLMLRRRIRRHP